MLTSVLVPLDGTALAETALHPATVLAHRLDARMILLVRSIDTWPKEAPAPPDTFTALFSAEDYLAATARQVTASGVPVHLAVSVDTPAEGISAEAAYSQADLIVMATHGRTGLAAPQCHLGSAAPHRGTHPDLESDRSSREALRERFRASLPPGPHDAHPRATRWLAPGGTSPPARTGVGAASEQSARVGARR